MVYLGMKTFIVNIFSLEKKRIFVRAFWRAQILDDILFFLKAFLQFGPKFIIQSLQEVLVTLLRVFLFIVTRYSRVLWRARILHETIYLSSIN